MTRTRLALCVGCGLVGLAIGHGIRPEPEVRVEVEERERVVEVYGRAEEWVTRRDVQTDTQTVRVVYRERTPDGTEREIERTTTGTSTTDRTEAAGKVVEVVEREVVREVEKRVEVTTPLPDWRAAALVGAELGGGIVYGAQLERRILGPISIGAWGHTGGAVGASLSLSF